MKKRSLTFYTLAGITAISLSACQAVTSLPDMWSSDSDDNVKNNSVYYPESSTGTTQNSSSTNNSTAPAHSTAKVSVPPSYYLAEGTPVSHQNADQNWVEEQNSDAYTIQLATGTAPTVAKTLQNTPKDQRMAQVKSTDGYVGVYGTFPSKAAADAALAKLPADVQKTAQVQSWNNVQENVVSEPATPDASIAPPTVQ